MKLSVSIVTYNHEAYIAEAIRSAVEQKTDFDFEIVVGEDCSTDGTRQIVRKLAEEFPDKIIPIYRDKNVGMMRNFADTIKSCRGRYVALLDGDDVWTYDKKLQEQVDFLEGNPDFAIAFHNMLVEYEDAAEESHPFHAPVVRGEFYSPIPKPVSGLEKILAGNFMQTSSVVFKNGLFGEFPEEYFNLKVGDWPLHAMNARKGKIFYFGELWGKYRVLKSSVWSSKTRGQRSRDLLGVYDFLNTLTRGSYKPIIDKEIDYYANEVIKEFGMKGGEALKSGDNRAALESFDAVLEALKRIGRKMPNIRYARAMALAGLGDYRQAGAELKKELDLNPAHAGARNLMKALGAKIQASGGDIYAQTALDFAREKKPRKPKPTRPKPTLDFSIIIPVKNGLDLTANCLEGIAKTSGLHSIEIIVIDNDSDDETAEFVKDLNPAIKLIQNFPAKNYSESNNQGAEIAKGKYLIFLNNDTKPFPGWLDAFEAEFEENESTAVQGAKLLYENGKIQHAGIVFGPRAGLPPHPYHIYITADATEPNVNKRREMQFVTGACMAVRPEVFDRIGGFDEEYEFGWEDTDFCAEIRKQGFSIVYNPNATLYHYESGTKKTEEAFAGDLVGKESEREKKNRERFYRKHGSTLVEDANKFYKEDGFEIRGGSLFRVDREETKPEAETRRPNSSFAPEFWRRDYEKAAMVLIKPAAAIGDALTTASVVRELKKLYPHLRIYISGVKIVGEVFKAIPEVDGFVEYGSDEEIHTETFADEVIDYNGLIGGFREYYNSVPLQSMIGNVAGIKFENRDAHYVFEQKELDEAKRIIEKFRTSSPLAGVQFATGKDVKRSYPRGAETIKRLLQFDPNMRFVNFGLEKITTRRSEILDCARDKIPFRTQMAVAYYCDAFLAIDSAFFNVGHNLLKKPTLAIVGLTNPLLIGNPANEFDYVRKSGLDCRECYWLTNCKIECMWELPPQSVAEAFVKVLKKRGIIESK